jgi:hypothetical protein
MKIVCVNPAITVKEGTTKAGKPYRMRIQTLVLDNGEFDRKPFNYVLGNDEAALTPGEYTIAPSAYFIDQYQELQFGRLKVVPMDAAEKAKPARLAG